ncbi:hypothetical protein MAPG_09465 [Magnaporthiopsis poae ATCC 64411]|uniref:Zn(2)-C6 fungal-type domain-containing protein n=1 Tax=Magnaporthiopsis poae (strain ATCC 64411 / 73-15) TaxID=644358 RepID=A0A0C4EA11_MAGP6|nr:hypothetical protein MAPG_09465 [Magnaporthiopsis poae ATCC 64411]
MARLAMSSVSSSGSAGPSRRAQGVPPKQKKTRSRNGCPQCKQKRLKCDETRPACLMCTRAGRKCPGYSQEFRWSTKHEKALDSAASREPSSFGTLLTAVSKVLTTEPAPAAQQPSPGHVPQPQRSLPIQTVSAASAAAPPPAVFTQLQTSLSSCSEAGLLSPTGSGTTTLDLSTPSPEAYPAEHIELPLQNFQCHSWDTLLADDDAAALGTVGMYGHGGLQMMATQPMLRPSLQAQFGTSQHLATEAPDAFIPWIPRSVMDRNSMLVEEWFKHVCTIWSCFDSDLNLNRKIAAGAWTRSEPVMRCMQSMAATCLSSQMPQMRRVAIASLKSAIASIKTELRLAGPALARGVFPTDLLLSLCCVGTAACWIDTKQLAARFLREARNIMHRLNRDANAGFLRPEDREALEFFNNSIIYWDMLVAVVSDDDHDTSSGDPDSEGNLLLLRAGYSADRSGLIIPPPLDRHLRRCSAAVCPIHPPLPSLPQPPARRSISTGAALRAALRYIAEAQGLEEELLGLEQIGVERVAETGDRLTPREHMVDVGEGYRLASLLQLYQTFPDLVVRRLPEALSGDGHVVPWDRWVVPLSLRLIGTLKRVPPDSGTRCIQPLLYLSASTGLKFDYDTMAAGLQQRQLQQQQQQQRQQVPQEQTMLAVPLDESVGDPALPQGGVQSPLAAVAETEAAEIELDEALSSLDAPTDDNEPSPGPVLHGDMNNVQDINDLLQAPLTKMSIEVSHARRFVLERLSALEHSLPPAPVRVARDLVTAVWAAYDAEPPGSNHTHWIDVMEDKDLKTIFG